MIILHIHLHKMFYFAEIGYLGYTNVVDVQENIILQALHGRPGQNYCNNASCGILYSYFLLIYITKYFKKSYKIYI